MLRHEFATELATLLDSLRSGPVAEVATDLADVLGDPHMVLTAIHVAPNHVAAGRELERVFSPMEDKIADNAPMGRVFVHAEVVTNLLDASPLGHVSRFLGEALRSFTTQLDAALTEKSSLNYLQLASSARRLVDTVEEAGIFLAEVEAAWGSEAPPDHLSHLEVTLYPQALTPAVVARKLAGMEGLYADVCEMHGVSLEEQPITVVRLETDCLFMELSGDPLVIGFMVWILKDVYQYLRRTYTRAGRIFTQREMVRAAVESGILRDEMKARGLDVTEADRNLEDFTASVTGELAAILEGEAEGIEIDGERIEPIRDPGRREIEGHTPRMLGSGPVEFRKSKTGHKWHWCRNCRYWPKSEYDPREEHPEAPPEPACGFCARLADADDCAAEGVE